VTVVPRLATLEELARCLQQCLRLIREIERSRLLVRLQHEDERWPLVAEALRATQAPVLTVSLANVRGVVASALEVD
jgi:hypothetical protein